MSKGNGSKHQKFAEITDSTQSENLLKPQIQPNQKNCTSVELGKNSNDSSQKLRRECKDAREFSCLNVKAKLKVKVKVTGKVKVKLKVKVKVEVKVKVKFFEDSQTLAEAL